MVPQFQIEKDFTSDAWQHLGSRKVISEGMHVMLLVGVRQEGCEKRYLLQNWWKNKPFVEVDSKYLASFGDTVYFVVTPQTKMGGCLSVEFIQSCRMRLFGRTRNKCTRRINGCRFYNFE